LHVAIAVCLHLVIVERQPSLRAGGSALADASIDSGNAFAGTSKQLLFSLPILHPARAFGCGQKP
jgi:hypothetical protein